MLYDIIMNSLASTTQPIPDFVIQGWLGTLNNQQRQSVGQDISMIYSSAFENKSPSLNVEKPLYIATAGSPLTGKSTLLESVLNSQTDSRYSNIVRTDPDEYVLPQMHYSRSLLPNDASPELVYQELRAGSNVIANSMLNDAAMHRYHIAHGTTLSSSKSADMLDAMGELGYTRRILLSDAPEEARHHMKAYREALGDVHVTKRDFINKGIKSAQSTVNALLHGDEVDVYWKQSLESQPILAASYRDGDRVVYNEAAFNCYIENYQNKRAILEHEGLKLPMWQELEASYQSRHHPLHQQQSWQEQVMQKSSQSSYIAR